MSEALAERYGVFSQWHQNKDATGTRDFRARENGCLEAMLTRLSCLAVVPLAAWQYAQPVFPDDYDYDDDFRLHGSVRAFRVVGWCAV